MHRLSSNWVKKIKFSSLMLLAFSLCHCGGEIGQTRSQTDHVNNSSALNLPLDEVLFLENLGGHKMGNAIATAKAYVAIGIPGLNQVQILQRDDSGNYPLIQTITMPAGLNGIQSGFGNALAMSDDASVLLVGTMKEDYSSNPPPENFTGRVLLYTAGANGYEIRQQLIPSTGHKTFGRFGQSLAIIPQQAVIISEEGEKQIHIFEYNATTDKYTSSAALVINQVNSGMVPDGSYITSFGTVVAAAMINGKLKIAVGAQDAHIYPLSHAFAPDETTPDGLGSTAARTGTVVLLEKVAGQYQMIDYLVPHYFKTKNMGFSIVMKGSRLLVGAIYSRVFVPQESGSAMVWELGADNHYVEWGTVSGLEAYSVFNAKFGFAVDLCGPNNEYFIVGRPGGFGTDQGRGFVYRINGMDDLVLEHDFVGSLGNPAPSINDLNDQFGFAVRCNDYGDVFYGAPFNDNPNTAPLYDGSKVYLFR